MRKFAYIDALRGFAISTVIYHHAHRNIEIWGAMGEKRALNPWLHALGAAGARGVQLFFVVSALTLLISQYQRNQESKPWRAFYVRRFFRIAPLFYLALIWYTFVPAMRGKIPWPNAWHVLTTFTFTNGWTPYWINVTNAVVPGAWSVAVEMAFYAAFPFLFLWIRSLKVALLTASAAFAASFLLFRDLSTVPIIDNMDVWRTFCFTWLPNQIATFLMGFVVFFVLRKDNDLVIEGSKRTPYLGILWISVLLLIPLSTVADNSPVSLYLYSIDFAIIAIAMARTRSIWFVNRFWCYVGKVSFSAYLLHFAVLTKVNQAMLFAQLEKRLTVDTYFLVLGSLGLLSTIALATATYELVEKPGIEAGKAINRRLGNNSRAHKEALSI